MNGDTKSLTPQHPLVWQRPPQLGHGLASLTELVPRLHPATRPLIDSRPGDWGPGMCFLGTPVAASGAARALQSPTKPTTVLTGRGFGIPPLAQRPGHFDPFDRPRPVPRPTSTVHRCSWGRRAACSRGFSQKAEQLTVRGGRAPALRQPCVVHRAARYLRLGDGSICSAMDMHSARPPSPATPHRASDRPTNVLGALDG